MTSNRFAGLMEPQTKQSERQALQMFTSFEPSCDSVTAATAKMLQACWLTPAEALTACKLPLLLLVITEIPVPQDLAAACGAVAVHVCVQAFHCNARASICMQRKQTCLVC